MKQLMISTDRKIFEARSAVRARMVEYEKKYEELHIVIFTNKKSGFKNETIAPNVFVYPTHSLVRLGYITGAYKIGKSIIQKWGSVQDALVTCQDPFETGIVGFFLKKKYGTKLELQIHTDLHSPYFARHSLLNHIRVFIADTILPYADHIRVVSKRIQESVSRKLDITKEKIEVRPIATDREKLLNAPISIDLKKKYPQYSKIVLMISRLEKEKNIPFALRVWSEIVKKQPTCGLVIVGSGSQEQELRNISRSLGIEKNIQFEGWQTDTASYYKTADLFLNASLYEGYGLTLVEADMLGRPIVTSNVGVADELSHAHVCPVNDMQCFMKKIEENLRNI